MGKTGKAKGSTKTTTPEVFLRLFPFVREPLRSLFALIIALLIAVVSVLTTSTFMSGKLRTVALVATCVLCALLGIAAVPYVVIEVVFIWRGSLQNPPTPPSSSATLPSLSASEKVIMNRLFDLVNGTILGADLNYLPKKLQLPRQSLTDLFDRLRQ
jgi:hypothetical protein